MCLMALLRRGGVKRFDPKKTDLGRGRSTARREAIEVEPLVTNVESLRLEVEAHKEEVVSLRREKEELDYQVKSLECKLTMMDHELEIYKESTKKVIEDKTALETEHCILAYTKESLDKENKNLTARVSQYDKTMEVIMERVENEKVELDAIIKALNNENASLRNKIDELTQSMDALENEKASLRNGIDELTQCYVAFQENERCYAAQFGEITSRNDMLSNQVRELEGKLQGSESRDAGIRAMETRIKELEAQLAEAENRKEEDEEELERQERDIKELSVKIEKMSEESRKSKFIWESRLNRSEEETAEKHKKLLELQGLIALKDAHIAELRGKLEQDLARVQADREAHEIAVGNYMDSIRTLEVYHQSLKSIQEIFVDSITLQPMIDPVMASDGHLYDRTHIETWFQRGKLTSPKTNQPISRRLLPNHSLKAITVHLKVLN